MFDRIWWFLEDHIVVKMLVFVIVAVALTCLLGVLLFFAWGVLILVIRDGWNQTIAPMMGKTAITLDQANSLFWFVVTLFFIAGLAFGTGKRIFGGNK